MTSTLEQLRDFLAGTADEESAQEVRNGLADGRSALTRFLEDATEIARRPFALDWKEIFADADDSDAISEIENDLGNDDLGEYIERQLNALRASSRPNSVRPKSKLERVRTRFARGHKGQAPEGAGSQLLNQIQKAEQNKEVMAFSCASILPIARPDNLPAIDLEDDVDLPNGKVLQVCTVTGKFWHLSPNAKICPGCGMPLASHNELGVSLKTSR